MKNLELRKVMKRKRVKQWQIAENIGISEFTLSRKLRHELSQDDKSKLMKIIDDISKKGD